MTHMSHKCQMNKWIKKEGIIGQRNNGTSFLWRFTVLNVSIRLRFYPFHDAFSFLTPTLYLEVVSHWHPHSYKSNFPPEWLEIQSQRAAFGSFPKDSTNENSGGVNQWAHSTPSCKKDQNIWALCPLSWLPGAVKHLISLSLVAAAWWWPSSEVAGGFLVRCL